MEKIKKIFSLLIITLIILILVIMASGTLLFRISSIDWNKQNDKEGVTYKVDWETLYPYKEYADKKVEDVKNNKDSDIWNKRISKYCETMRKLGSIDESVGIHLYGYKKIVELGGALNSILSDSEHIGTKVRLQNGYWANLEEQADKESYKEIVNGIETLKCFLDESNTPFLYILPPSKICQYDKKLPNGEEDYTNSNMDVLLSCLKDRDVPYLDLRKYLHNDFGNHYRLFYKTDHHWNVSSGLWASRTIGNYLRDRYEIDFDGKLCDKRRYENKVYKNALFGSEGQTVGRFLLESEDLVVPMPKFDTKFSIRIKDKKINSIGTFENLFINYDILHREIKKGGGFAYETIMYGNRPLVQIVNKNNDKGPRILMIKDSMGLAVSPYLAVGCSRLDLIDSRSANGNFDGSIETYIKKMKPDVVLLLMANSPSNMPISFK